jgi:hypothetical protein
VEGNIATPCKKIEEIRESLGVRTADNLSSARLVLICEGTDDVLKLRPLIEELSPELKRMLQEGEFAIQSTGGCGKLTYYVSVLQNAICDVVALLDDDKPGREAWEKARKGNLLDTSEIFFTTVGGLAEAELEDLLDDEFVKDHLLVRYGVDISAVRKNDKSLKFSERLGKAFKNHGKPFDDDIKAEVKHDLSEAVALKGIAAYSDWRLSPIRALVAQIERRASPSY